MTNREYFFRESHVGAVALIDSGVCCRRRRFDRGGVRRKSWTGLCCKSEALSVF